MNKDTKDVIDYLKKGKVGIFPTDTAFGIGCRMDKVSSVDKIYKLRNRPSEKALLVLVSSIGMAEKYVFIPQKVKEELIEKYWPGGLTIIFKCKKEKVPSIIRAGGDTLAVRLPDHKKLLQIIEKVGVPIVAPSANFTGAKTPLKLSEVDKRLVEKVDFIMSGVCTIKGVSTIIDCSKKKWEIVRQGVIRIQNSEFRKCMNILTIDTRDNQRVVAKLEKDGKEFVEISNSENHHPESILKLIDLVLEKAKITVHNIDEIFVEEGPGSYTGLKVGASVANALSFALQKKVNKKTQEFVVPKYE